MPPNVDAETGRGSNASVNSRGFASFFDPLLGAPERSSAHRSSFSMLHGSENSAVVACWGWGVAGQLGLNNFDNALK